MLKTMARQGPLLSSTTLVRLFRLLDVKVPRGNEESFASSPYRAVSAAAALHTQQASEVLSPPQIADCFNMYSVPYLRVLLL